MTTSNAAGYTAAQIDTALRAIEQGTIRVRCQDPLAFTAPSSAIVEGVTPRLVRHLMNTGLVQQNPNGYLVCVERPGSMTAHDERRQIAAITRALDDGIDAVTEQDEVEQRVKPITRSTQEGV